MNNLLSNFLVPTKKHGNIKDVRPKIYEKYIINKKYIKIKYEKLLIKLSFNFQFAFVHKICIY